MKCFSKSALCFLVGWLMVVMAGYLLSHNDVFAAGGGAPACEQCIYCQEFSQFTDGVAIGYTPKGMNTPWVASALNGTANGGNLDLWTTGCNNAGYAEDYSPLVPLTNWAIKNGQDTCTLPTPPPQGIVELENSQLDMAQFFINQSFCANTD